MSKNQEKPVLVRENEDLVELHPKSSQDDHERHSRVKHGGQRLDKRSAQGVSGLPKKSGQGGKYTWGDPRDASLEQTSVAALDENDPNYVDEEEEEVDKKVASSVVEVSKSENSAQTHEKV